MLQWTSLHVPLCTLVQVNFLAKIAGSKSMHTSGFNVRWQTDLKEYCQFYTFNECLTVSFMSKHPSTTYVDFFVLPDQTDRWQMTPYFCLWGWISFHISISHLFLFLENLFSMAFVHFSLGLLVSFLCIYRRSLYNQPSLLFHLT